MESIWEKDIKRNRFDALNGNKNTDVLIIGGGIAGILCAYKLKSIGVDCILVEANEICCGITKNTTAKITYAHGLIYDKLIKRFGFKKARLYLDAQIKACSEYAERCKSIDCDYESIDAYVYSLRSKKLIEKEISALERLGVKPEASDAPNLPLRVAGALKIKNQAQFHPLKFLYSIVKELPIYEHTSVTELTPKKAITNQGEITYKKLIITTHFPILNKHGLYPLKLYQDRSYFIALKNAPSVDGIYVDEANRGMSFRNYNDLLFIGGGDHRTGKPGKGWKEIEIFAKKHFKNAEIVGRWATQDCMSLDGVPYIGQYSKSTPNVFIATGFNKWGITNSMVAANILCDLIQGKRNPYSIVFSPSRSILHLQLAINAFEATIGLITPTVPRCPHLGCALKYNSAEHSWDCPCHGSRFSIDGDLLDNPATDDKKMKK